MIQLCCAIYAEKAAYKLATKYSSFYVLLLELLLRLSTLSQTADLPLLFVSRDTSTLQYLTHFLLAESQY